MWGMSADDTTCAGDLAMTTTTTATISKISTAILAKMAEGLPVDQAFDAVLGAGSYAKLAGEVWEALFAMKAALA